MAPPDQCLVFLPAAFVEYESIGQKFLGDLTLELDSVGSVSRHGLLQNIDALARRSRRPRKTIVSPPNDAPDFYAKVEEGLTPAGTGRSRTSSRSANLLQLEPRLRVMLADFCGKAEFTPDDVEEREASVATIFPAKSEYG